MNTRKVNPLIRAINNYVQSSKQEGHALITRAKQMEEQRMIIRAKYSGAFKDLNAEEASTLFITSTSYHCPVIHLTLHDLEGFKDPKLVDMLGFFLQFTDKVEEKEWARFLNKDYTIQLDDVRISISAYVRDGSPTCRKVATGTRIEEVTTYRIECN